MKTLLVRALAVLLLALPVQAAPLSGVKSVGPTGDYASITAAIADVQAVGNGLGGALVLELQAAYVCTIETFPLTIPSLNGASAVNTLTIRPATGATALSISSADTTAATVDLNGAQFVTIDGRPGGVGSNAGSGGGTASQLTIANTSTAGVALRFINEASSNIIRYTTLRGVNTSQTSGTVLFGSTTGANGNDNNAIDHCDIRDGATTPTNGIYSSGTTTTTAQANSGNTISNCNIFNFYATVVSSAGVRLSGGNTDWILTGNSFYQTASRAAVAAQVNPILIGNTSGNNFTVTGNFIGGSAPNAGSTAWTTTGTAAGYRFSGIELVVGTATPSSVQGNTIANIVWTSSDSSTPVPGVWSGIWVVAGSVNIGTVTGNIIGSGTGTGSVSVTTAGNGGTSFGIGSTGPGTLAIANNTIGSITVNGTASTISASFTGIEVDAGANTISNNIVGSATTANSLNAATSSTSTTGQQVTGILSLSVTVASITGNTVANLNNNSVQINSGAGQIRGIVTSAGVNTIIGNTVRNLSTTSQNTQTTTGQSVVGIIDTSSTAGQNVSQNTVHSLANTAASAAVTVTGIYHTGTGPNVIARNLVHSLAVSSTSASSQLKGMEFFAGTFTAQNNMVRVGVAADGNGLGTGWASTVWGILDSGPTNGRNFYHNSVHVGGFQRSGASNTYAFQSTSTAFERECKNNIFVNARTNDGSTGKHYAVAYGGTGTNPPSLLNASSNIFLASGTGAHLGLYNSIDRDTLAVWQAATGQDAASAATDPRFVNPNGTATTVDLHLQSSNPAERGGIPIAAVTDDFDGQTRSTLMPADVGADAGNFTLSGDVFAPIISYPPLTNGSTANRVLTGWATITDNVGVAGGANAPRLYFKKSTDADAFGVANDSTGNGWKYATATGSGPYSFTLDYSLINGGSVSFGDSIQYFVVAQDAVNNLGSSPAASSSSANPPVQNVNGHGAVNSFSILPGISGTVTVGSGGTYPSLSGAGGLFAALNGAVLTGNVLVNITGDLTETGGVTLSQFNTDEYPPTRTLTILPDSATMRTISGSVNTGLITLNGVGRVIIDGRFGGSGRYLTFRNTNTGASANTIRFIFDASGNTVRNCVVEGATSNSLGVIGFSFGVVTGNCNNLITDCQVRDLSTAVGVPYVLIGSTGSSDAVANSGNTISNNELFNFKSSGISIPSTGNASWTISWNDIHEVNPVASSQPYPIGVEFGSSGTNLITGNFIHDLLTTSTAPRCMMIDSHGTTTVSGNRITAFNVDAATTNVFGISAVCNNPSTLNVVNNQITLSPATPGSTTLIGFYDFGSTGGVVNVFHNSIVLGGTETGARNSWASYRNISSAHTARDNLFLNLRTGGTGSHFAAGSERTGGSYTLSNNVYAGTGATAANFMDFNSSPVSFAAWQSSTGDTASQAGVAGGGSFTAAMFVSAATGDLHLVPGGNALVNARGTPIAGITTDYDGDPRHGTLPTIGADEGPAPSAFTLWAAQNGVVYDPNAVGANGQRNVVNFAFGINPLAGGGNLQFNGTFGAGGTIGAVGMPVSWMETGVGGADFRALFVRRKDAASVGLTYGVEFCDAALAGWVPSVVVPTVLADDGTEQIVSVPFPAPIIGGGFGFFRVNVTLAP